MATKSNLFSNAINAILTAQGKVEKALDTFVTLFKSNKSFDKGGLVKSITKLDTKLDGVLDYWKALDPADKRIVQNAWNYRFSTKADRAELSTLDFIIAKLPKLSEKDMYTLNDTVVKMIEAGIPEVAPAKSAPKVGATQVNSKKLAKV